jgi:beta-lactamase superfamily II metal-dependent hydrolase
MTIVRLIPLILSAFCAVVMAQEPGILRVHFVDVGQGDAVLIQSPSGQNAVYDAGEDPTRMRDYLTDHGVTHVGLVVASHNHADHIGGLPEVMTLFRPAFYMDSGIPSTTLIYARVLDAAAHAGSQLLEPTQRRVLMGDVSLQVIPPPGIAAWDQNDNSIGPVVEYGSFRLSLAGDAEAREWAWWRTHAPDWLTPVQVHKASHHGSIHGDSTDGIAALSPEAVVVGVGGGNSYGHPDPGTLGLYAEHGAKIYRTDAHGTVIIEAEPSGTFTVQVERGEGAQPPPVPPVPAPVPPPTRPQQASCIDLNTASVIELQQIVHIGAVRAQEIVDLRRIQPFRSVNDLVRVNGIGPARLRDIIAEGKACVR